MDLPKRFLFLFIFTLFLYHVKSYPVEEMDEPLWKENPEEQGPYFEGDIIIPNARKLSKLPKLWQKGIIPYEIEKSFVGDQRDMLNNAINEINSKTCINLIPRTKEKDFISFRNDETGCWSSVGKVGGRQVINLESQCLKTVGTGIHEILHSVGLYHEQNRSDRDNHVDIKQENIKVDKVVNFQKVTVDVYDISDVSYDYGSIMHYSPYSFSKNGKATIETKGSPSTKKLMGQRAALSANDIKKISNLYNCTDF